MKLANIEGMKESDMMKLRFGGLIPAEKKLEADKQVKILNHRNNKFLKLDDVNIGEEAVNAIRSENFDADIRKLGRLMTYINK